MTPFFSFPPSDPLFPSLCPFHFLSSFSTLFPIDLRFMFSVSRKLLFFQCRSPETLADDVFGPLGAQGCSRLPPTPRQLVITEDRFTSSFTPPLVAPLFPPPPCGCPPPLFAPSFSLFGMLWSARPARVHLHFLGVFLLFCQTFPLFQILALDSQTTLKF